MDLGVFWDAEEEEKAPQRFMLRGRILTRSSS